MAERLAMLNRRSVRATGMRLVLFGLVGILALTALGLLLTSVFLGALEIMAPAWAALLTAGTAGVMAGGLLAATRRPVRALPPSQSDLAEQMAPALYLAVGTKPWLSVALAVALGAFAELARKPPSGPRAP